ncbi:hypothetical protein PBOI14_40490 [Pseudomonas sp. Boi14]|nr:hypothetical protein PBOI14_40490 [Pseudomonas sp. Boi14]
MFKLSTLGRGHHIMRRTLLAQALFAGALSPVLAQAQAQEAATVSQAGSAQERRVSLNLPAQPWTRR